ncbi:lens fiber membrane intrinsic protein isoform X1 [Hydra vulgaris]|nr:lens fiber membrane intrinsic protein-like [Hydra vulgaris]
MLSSSLLSAINLCLSAKPKQIAVLRIATKCLKGVNSAFFNIQASKMTALKIIYFINCGLMVLGIVLAVLSTAGNYWEKISSTSTLIHVGLWKICGKPLSTSYCADRDKTDALIATEAFMIAGCVTYLLGFVYNGLLFLKKNWSNKISAVLLIVTALCLVVGLGVYTNKVSEKDASFGWSYIIGWCSAGVSVLSTILCFTQQMEYASI